MSAFAVVPLQINKSLSQVDMNDEGRSAGFTFSEVGPKQFIRAESEEDSALLDPTLIKDACQNRQCL
jgi:hypothetical protein